MNSPHEGRVAAHPQRVGGLALALVVFSASACGGTVVFEEGESGGANAGGNGGLGAGGSSSGQTTGAGNTGNVSNGGSSQGGTSVGTSTVSTTGQGGATTCGSACSTLWLCGLEDGNCPGFANISEAYFVDGCLLTCEDNPAVPSLIDANDCQGTVDVFINVSPAFADVCLGFDGDQ